LSAGEDEGSSLSAEAGALLDNPREYIRGIVATFVVSSVLSVVTFAVSTGIDIWESLRSSLSRAGGAVTGDVSSLWASAAELVALPIRISGDLAASAGVFAPLVAAGAFALTAAISGAIVWLIYRLVIPT